jgi:Putative serine esterase (DUF676)
VANVRFGSAGQFTAQMDDTPDPSLPLVILLHGMGGDVLDMTSPLTSIFAGFAFNRAATFTPYTDRGFNLTPPIVPVNGFFLDPAPLTLTSWRSALNAAGFSTATYSQVGPLIANDVAQLTALAVGPLSTISKYAKLHIAFVAHSRGGILARAFLASARTNPALAAFLPRIKSCITLHSPHGGSALVNAGAGIDALVARVQGAFGALGLPSPGALASLRGFLVNPSRTELAVGSATLAGITGEPVPGVAYHTFGGMSTALARVWANVFTPDSALPLPVPFVPFPLFHHGTVPVVIGVPLDVRTLIPPAVLVPLPVITELVAATTVLAASVPEIGPGTGDILVAAARAHLPFSATAIDNPLNHAEALSDPTLQAQVIAILSRLRTPTLRPQAVARITPFPASIPRATHTVTASDAATGMAITSGVVVIRDAFGGVLLRTTIGVPFSFAFRATRTIVFNRGHSTVNLIYPTVTTEFGPPYDATVSVDTGL